MNATVPSEIVTSANTATAVLRTLVLCDLVDSTALVERLGDQRAAELFRKHDRLARALLQQHGGQEIDKTDGFLLLYERPIQAVAFALVYQHDLAALSAGEKTVLSARIGIHIGDVVIWENIADDIKRGAKQTEVEGLVKPVTARLMNLALPGQILLSGAAYDIAHRAQGELGERLADVRWRAHGRYRFKGVPDMVPVFEVGEEGLAPLKPPPWTSKAHRETPIWRRPALLGFELLIVALLIATPIFYLTRPVPAIAFANRDWVVVGDLKNLTGHKVFDDSLQTAFRVGLEQSRYINVVPALQVHDALKRMERDPATKVDRGVGAEIALREGARAGFADRRRDWRPRTHHRRGYRSDHADLGLQRLGRWQRRGFRIAEHGRSVEKDARPAWRIDDEHRRDQRAAGECHDQKSGCAESVFAGTARSGQRQRRRGGHLVQPSGHARP